MQINRLCFILPADFDEIAPLDHTKSDKPAMKEVKKHPYRECGSQILDFIGGALRRFYDSKWVHFCHHDVPSKQQPSVFHDLEGVQMLEKVGGENPRIFSYAELYIGSNGFSEDEILGSGGFGKVYRAVLPSDGTAVAVKCLAEKGERIGGTIGYLPPESFQKRSVATAKSDVFSFGIVVLEVVSGRRAVDLTFPDEQIILLDWIRRLSDEGRLLHAGDTRLTDGSYRLADMDRLLHIGLLCTLHNPLLRPNMKWIVEVLSGNISGKLPALPSFESHPLYISLSSPSNTSGSKSTTGGRSSTTTSTNTTVTFASSNYVTATEETLYATAEFGINSSSLYHDSSRRPTNFFVVETPREISFKELISATNNFAESNREAELDFGTAYQGFLDNHHHILVKRLGMTKCPALRTRFSDELQNLARLRHRNLVQLRGWCTEQGEMLVVYDYSLNRLLSHLLFHHNNRIGSPILRWQHRYSIIKSLASAILYLHEEWDEQVIHRNITSSAIILDSEMNPRLGSFALAEFLTRNDHGHHAATNKNKSVRGIFGYMSPEYMESGEATPMADVYSFGVVVLEVVSGHMAADFRRPEVLLVKRVHDFETQRRPLEELVDIRLNEEYNDKELLRLTKLGIACTRSDPELRPTMRQIVSILDGNDKIFMEEGQRKEGTEEWKQRNASSLSLVKGIHALGIH
ncbi:hypothetical protein QUC31_016842 [Theobroma cacao]